ncbi:hypothetical protein ACLBSN_16115, partial [Klebsiella pneumoniae]
HAAERCRRQSRAGAPVPPKEGRLRSRFYQLQAIEKEWMEDDGSVSLQVRMPIVDWRRLCKQEPTLVDYVV